MGLVDFHKRKLKALVAHIVMCLLSHTLVSLIKLFDKITDCIKENLFKAFTGVKAGGRG